MTNKIFHPNTMLSALKNTLQNMVRAGGHHGHPEGGKTAIYPDNRLRNSVDV
jgi:hypothetical protein